MNSLDRWHSLTQILIRSNGFGEYNKRLSRANKLSIIEKANETKTFDKGKKFYLPHRPVIPESAEAARIRIV